MNLKHNIYNIDLNQEVIWKHIFSIKKKLLSQHFKIVKQHKFSSLFCGNSYYDGFYYRVNILNSTFY